MRFFEKERAYPSILSLILIVCSGNLARVGQGMKTVDMKVTHACRATFFSICEDCSFSGFVVSFHTVRRSQTKLQTLTIQPNKNGVCSRH